MILIWHHTNITLLFFTTFAVIPIKECLEYIFYNIFTVSSSVTLFKTAEKVILVKKCCRTKHTFFSQNRK